MFFGKKDFLREKIKREKRKKKRKIEREKRGVHDSKGKMTILATCRVESRIVYSFCFVFS